MIVAGFGGLCLLGFKIYSLIMLILYHTRLSSAATLAQQVWSRYEKDADGRWVQAESVP